VSFLVDTNVISELRKRGRCDAGVAAWMEEIPSREIYLSAITLGEIRKGIENLRRRDAPAAQTLEGWLGEVIAAHSDRILPVDARIAEQWGRFSARDPLPVLDGLLAATAAVHGLTLVTRNLRDVERTGVSCHNPFLP
jgi:predicted nucleic acid-binding protein